MSSATLARVEATIEHLLASGSIDPQFVLGLLNEVKEELSPVKHNAPANDPKPYVATWPIGRDGRGRGARLLYTGDEFEIVIESGAEGQEIEHIRCLSPYLLIAAGRIANDFAR